MLETCSGNSGGAVCHLIQPVPGIDLTPRLVCAHAGVFINATLLYAVAMFTHYHWLISPCSDWKICVKASYFFLPERIMPSTSTKGNCDVETQSSLLKLTCSA
jgi:hypothetical protein